MAIAVFLGQLHRDTQRPASRDDRDLVDRIGTIREHLGDNGMSRFMIGSIQPFLFRHHNGAPLDTHDDLIFREFELLHRHFASAGPGGKECGLIHEVGEIRTRESRRTPRDDRRIYITIHRHLAHVDFQDRLTSANVRQWYVNLAVKPAGAQ